MPVQVYEGTRYFYLSRNEERKLQQRKCELTALKERWPDKVVYQVRDFLLEHGECSLSELKAVIPGYEGRSGHDILNSVTSWIPIYEYQKGKNLMVGLDGSYWIIEPGSKVYETE